MNFLRPFHLGCRDSTPKLMIHATPWSTRTGSHIVSMKEFFCIQLNIFLYIAVLELSTEIVLRLHQLCASLQHGGHERAAHTNFCAYTA